jgi:hypothetical protein
MKKLLIILILISLIFQVVLAADTIIKSIPENTLQWKTVSSVGIKQDVAVDAVKTMRVPTVMSFTTPTRIKSLQVYPESKVSVSEDTQTVMQQSISPTSPKAELYYGYQNDYGVPWMYYYKVENCDATKCRVVRAEFLTRKVWIEEINLDTGSALAIAPTIPTYQDLPIGVVV